MAIATFSSFEQCEVVVVSFLTVDGEESTLTLLVDSGFTGPSCFVLPADADYLAQAIAPASQATGALSGTQKRAVVHWRIASLSIERSAVAILADVSGFALPSGVDGLAGLTFLRHFSQWGAEQTEQGSWRFYLSTDPAKSR